MWFLLCWSVFIAFMPYHVISSSTNDSMWRNDYFNVHQRLIMDKVLEVYALEGPLNPVCKNHTMEFRRALGNLEPWALLMFDASSKLQSGILSGNVLDYGSLKQCINIQQPTKSGLVTGKQCSLTLVPDEELLRTIIVTIRGVSDEVYDKTKYIYADLTLDWPVCIPASCSSEEVLHHFKNTLEVVTEGLALNVTLTKADCYSSDEAVQVTVTQWIVIYVVLAVLGFMLLVTIVDVKKRNGGKGASGCQVIDAFSILRNVERLVEVKQHRNGSLDCLNGLRFLSATFVVVVHRGFVPLFNSPANSFEIVEMLGTYSSTLIVGGTVFVDTFLVISGLLATCSVLGCLEKGKRFDYPLYVIRRILRIFPLQAAVVLYYALFMHHFGYGPIWHRALNELQEPCQKYWWSALLNLQSYLNPKELCVAQTWYLTVNNTCYFLAPLVIIPLWKKPRLGRVMLLASFVATASISFYLAWINDYDALGLLTTKILTTDIFAYHYIQPHTRAAPFIMGMALGYALFKTKHAKVKISRVAVCAGWTATAVLMTGCIFGNNVFLRQDHQHDRFESSCVISLIRIVWSVGVLWIVWTCANGYGGPVNAMLSSKACRVLGQLAYAVYLVHYVFQFTVEANTRHPIYYSNFNLLYHFFGDFCYSLIISFTMCVLIEQPFLKAIDILMNPTASNKTTATNDVNLASNGSEIRNVNSCK